MTDALPARVTELETVSGEFRSRLDGVERAFIDDNSRFVVRFERLEQALLGLQARVLAAEDDAVPPPAPPPQATLREVAAHREDVVRKAQAAVHRLLLPPSDRVPNDYERGYKNGNHETVEKAVHAINSLLAAPAPQPPEPVEIPNVLGADGPFKLGSAISAIGDVVDVINGDSWKFTVDDHGRALEQIRVIVDDAIAPQPPPADGLVHDLVVTVKALLPLHRENAWTGCSDIAQSRVDAAEHILRKYDAYERERAKEQGRG